MSLFSGLLVSRGIGVGVRVVEEEYVLRINFSQDLSRCDMVRKDSKEGFVGVFRESYVNKNFQIT